MKQLYSYATVVIKGPEIRAPAPVSKNAPPAPPLPAELSVATRVAAQKLPVKYEEMKPSTSGQFMPRTKFHIRKMNMDMELFKDDSHRPTMQKASSDFKQSMKLLFPEAKVWLTGSFPAGVELLDSDIDFSVKIDFPDEEDLFSIGKLRRMREKLGKVKVRDITSNFERGHGNLSVFEDLNTISARVCVLKMKHRETGILIDVTVDDDGCKRNTQLLVWYGQMDSRFPLLCRAIKRWAKYIDLEGAFRGKLNCFTICLMVLHYLQIRQILPNLQALFPEITEKLVIETDDYQRRNLREELTARGWTAPENNTDVAVLFGRFLKYYAKFDFHGKWISVRKGRALEKKWDEDGNPLNGMPARSAFIVIEDPFIEPPWNCAQSVREQYMYTNIRKQFRLAFERLVKEQTIFANGQPSELYRRICSEQVRKEISFAQWRRNMSDEIGRKHWSQSKFLDGLSKFKRSPEIKSQSFWGHCRCSPYEYYCSYCSKITFTYHLLE